MRTQIFHSLEALAVFEGPQKKKFLKIVMVANCALSSDLSTLHVLTHFVLSGMEGTRIVLMRKWKYKEFD